MASRSRLAGVGFKPPGAAAFKRRGGEQPRKRHRRRCQVSIGKMSESKPSDDASLLPQGTARTGDDHWLQDKSGRYLFDRALERWAKRKYKALSGRKRSSGQWLRKMK